MGLNRLMMRNSEAQVEDGSKTWSYKEANKTTIAFTVPPGVKRIKVFAYVDETDAEHEGDYSAASIKNKINNKKWGEGYSETISPGEVDYQNIDEIVGVTSNKTYTLLFDCWATSGVTFSWGKAINEMTPTVEDY